MTTVISRVYKSSAAANRAAASLAEAGFPEATYEVIKGGPDAGGAIAAARVPERDVEAYLAALTGRATLVVVRAPFMPLGAARKAMELVDAIENVAVDVESQDVFIREQPKKEIFKRESVLRHHPRFFSPDVRPGAGRPGRLLSRVLRLPPIIRRAPKSSALFGGLLGEGFVSQRFIKYPLLSARRPAVNTVFPGGKRFFYDP